MKESIKQVKSANFVVVLVGAGLSLLVLATSLYLMLLLGKALLPEPSADAVLTPSLPPSLSAAAGTPASGTTPTGGTAPAAPAAAPAEILTAADQLTPAPPLDGIDAAPVAAGSETAVENAAAAPGAAAVTQISSPPDEPDEPGEAVNAQVLHSDDDVQGVDQDDDEEKQKKAKKNKRS